MESSNLLNKYRELTGFNNEENIDNLALPYVRVSTDIQVKYGHSIDAQIENISKYCRDNNLVYKEMYIDEGKSGKNIKRPAFSRLLLNLKPGATIVAYSLSRISRSMADFCHLYKLIQESQCKLVILDMPLLDGIQGKLMLHLLSALAEWERDMISERVKNTMKHMKETGSLSTKPPFGWTAGTDESGKKIHVKDEKEQLIIDYIRSLIASNENITDSEIVRDLKKNKITIRNSKDIYQSTIRNIISNNKLRNIKSI